MEGEYYLDNAREMASGFLIKPGGDFQFFFSYGALDRYGSGKWKLAGDQLVLNSAPKPAADFTLVKSSKTNSDHIIVRVEEPNPMLGRHVFCSLEGGADGSWEQMNGGGEAEFPLQPLKSISLLLEFCPERFSTIPVKSTDHNAFTFRFEPSIMEVFFENFSLTAGPEGLAGAHPLMQGNEFTYSRQ